MRTPTHAPASTAFSREVDLSSELLGVLRRHLDLQREELARSREEAFKEGKPTPTAPEMLFPNRAGNYIDWNNAVDAFHRICRKAKNRPLPPICLRHKLPCF